MKNILDFTDFDELNTDIKKKNFYFALKIISLLLLIFITKYVLKYNYFNYLPLFIVLFSIVIFSYPFVKKITKNTYLGILSCYICFAISGIILIFMSGGLRAPGLLWLAIIPFFGANLLEKRGFFVGILLVAIGYLFFLIANYFNFEMYPLVSIEHYLIEFRMNLLLFTLTTFSLTYFHVVSTSNFVNDLKKAKDRNENFFRILFHDLANPMQIIQMLIRKKHSNRTPEENEKIFLKIEKTSSRIVEIMEHVRKIKAVEDKNINLALEKVLIYPVVKSIKEELEKIGIERNIELVILNSPDNETSIFVDRSYFKHQILKNIISNAIKFSEDSGKIQIGWTIVHKKVEILIKDDGIGMPSEIKDHLFDKMKVASRRGVNGEIGTGYGLDIAKVFIEEFGGTMDIESFEKIGEFKKEGTTVILRFPI